MTILKNPFNYVGSKDKLISQIISNIDTTKTDFIDLFCGSGIVSVNVQNMFEYVHLNDGCWQVVRTIEYFRDTPIQEIISDIERYINTFNLSKTNKEGYLRARDFYNEKYKSEDDFNPALFYTLVTHSFSYNITFNSKEEFNVPSGAGRSYFNSNLRYKLIDYCMKLKQKFPTTSAFKFDDLLEVQTVANHQDLSDVMIYVDPPYYNSNNDAPYGRIYGLKWTEKEERNLYSWLDKVNDMGGSFLLSNTVENKGITNTILKEWMQKYTVIEVDRDYNNCSYQRNKEHKSKEIMVKNYGNRD